MLKKYLNDIICDEDSVLFKELSSVKKRLGELEKSILAISNTLDDALRQSGGELKRWIEITTKIGCSNNCTYCPQGMLLNSYCEKQKLNMTLEDFKCALSHIPKWLDIAFAGMNEPFENPAAFDMVEYAITNGYKVSVYTTLKGLSANQIEKFGKLNLRSIVIHCPDNEGMMKLLVDEEYLAKLRGVFNLKLPNVKYVCIGSIHKKIDNNIAKYVKQDKRVTFRAGNIMDVNKLSYELKINENCGRELDSLQKVICSRRINYNGLDRTATHVECSVLLPNGKLILCCQDYGLKHVLGNLYEQDYETIMYGDVMKEIEQSMLCSNNREILCRKCEFAYEYDKEKWKNFERCGLYK